MLLAVLVCKKMASQKRNFCTFILYHSHSCQLPKKYSRDQKPHPLDHTSSWWQYLYTKLYYLIIQQELPWWKIIQVTNEKLKLEKQRRIYLFGIVNSSVFISICVCIELFIYIILLRFSISDILPYVIPGNAYMTVCFRYLPLEEALSLELESYP